MKYVALTVAPGPLALPVTRRVVRAVGAAADLPLDRLDDAALLCDTLIAGGRNGLPAALEFTIRDDGLEIAFSGYAKDGAAPVLEGAVLPELGRVVDRLADHVWVESDAGTSRERIHVLVGRAATG